MPNRGVEVGDRGRSRSRGRGGRRRRREGLPPPMPAPPPPVYEEGGFWSGGVVLPEVVVDLEREGEGEDACVLGGASGGGGEQAREEEVGRGGGLSVGRVRRVL